MNYDINIDRSSDFSMSFVIKDSAGDIVNLTGATVNAQLREYAEASDSITFDTSHNGTGGVITIALAHESTDTISYSQGVYDVFITYSNSKVEKVLSGNAFIYSNTTRLVEGTYMRFVSFNSLSSFPSVGKADRLYLSIEDNKLYRWSGNGYVGITDPGTWGKIYGDISQQTDLKTALDAKANKNELGDIAYVNYVNLATQVTGITPISNGGTGANNASDARNNLGLGDLAVKGTADLTTDVTGVLPVANGGTGASTAAAARDNLGLGTMATKADVSTDGLYGRREVTVDGVSTISWEALGSMATMADATSDNVEYVRKNGSWVVNSGGGGSSSAAWGGIIGTLSNQTDLQEALDSLQTNIDAKASSDDLGNLAVKDTAALTTDVTGVLPIVNGGTGLTASPSMLTDISSTTAADVMQASPRPGITGTLPISNGGTGATTAANALSNLGAMEARPPYIDFQPPSSSCNYGGFIDFHYNQSTEDYTSRIYEGASGRINIIASNGVLKNGVAIPSYSYGTTDLTAGTSTLATGQIYLVYS